MKQKLLCILSLTLIFILSGCQQPAASSKNDANSSTPPISQNNQTTPDVSAQEGETPKVQENPALNSTEDAGKFTIIFKMISDGLELNQDKNTEKPGIAMVERGVSLMQENLAQLNLNDKVKTELETIQKGLTQIKEGKSVKEARQSIEKSLTEMKTKLGVQ